MISCDADGRPAALAFVLAGVGVGVGVHTHRSPSVGMVTGSLKTPQGARVERQGLPEVESGGGGI